MPLPTKSYLGLDFFYFMASQEFEVLVEDVTELGKTSTRLGAGAKSLQSLFIKCSLVLYGNSISSN